MYVSVKIEQRHKNWSKESVFVVNVKKGAFLYQIFRICLRCEILKRD